MTDSLREQVARRLRNVVQQEINRHGFDGDLFGVHADEVIRCMEWAVRAQMKHLGVAPVKCGTVGCDCEIGVVPLTLPPEDWHP